MPPTLESLTQALRSAGTGCLRIWGLATIDQYERYHGDGLYVCLTRLFFTQAAAEGWADWIARHSTRAEGRSYTYGYATEVHELRLCMEDGRLHLSRPERGPEPPGALLDDPPSPDEILALLDGTLQAWRHTLGHCRNLWPEVPLPDPEDRLDAPAAAPLPT